MFRHLHANTLSGTIPSSIGDLTGLTNNLYVTTLNPGCTIHYTILLLLAHYYRYLQINRLTGTIPSTIGKLTALKGALSLYSNKLVGTIPSTVGSLKILHGFLDFSLNELTGTIPSQLAALTRLNRILDLNGNRLTGTIPSELAELTALKTLLLSENHLTGAIPSQLAAMTSLSNLNLMGNQLNGSIPSELAHLNKLKQLRLHFNKLTGLVPPLPFSQYNLAGGGDCVLDVPTQCTNGDCNNFSCPLPPNSNKCIDGTHTVAVHCAYEPCVGASSSLTPTECNAWQDIFSATNGKGWSHCNDSRLDPCSCGGTVVRDLPSSSARPFVKCTNGHLTTM
jgi:hypothetical protein